ncbi:DUF2487 family protein [Caryophanon tenue]|uniref:DUF2487 domain-containing protein n=1 Tax=Caryophanon tenue TaxID=33978 RepID=A0A1C0Y539_9BACL|nr:DUF2487 family protein [Caryophanon tenue]OCS82298.1 hypothetical protein A6M13_07645 [Caryophanon tenue]
MKYTVQDMTIFQQQKQFIDTAIVPLVQLDFSEQALLQSSMAASYLLSLTNYIEQQFKGRMVLLPPVCYTMMLRSPTLLQNIHEELENGGFRHIFYITTDVSWRTIDAEKAIIWLPPIPLESMDQNVRKSILEDQLKQILPTFLADWNTGQ